MVARTRNRPSRFGLASKVRRCLRKVGVGSPVSVSFKRVLGCTSTSASTLFVACSPVVASRLMVDCALVLSCTTVMGCAYDVDCSAIGVC